MQASVLTDYRHLEWQQVPCPDMTASQVLVKVRYAGICGSDMHIYHGDFHPRTRVPLIMGHEFAGEIVDIGKDVDHCRVGDRVAVDPVAWCGQCPACRLGQYPACSSLRLLGIDSNGGFAQYAAAESFMLFPVADNVSDQHAALAEVLSIGFHACARAGVQAGDSLAIFGAGRIGQAAHVAAAYVHQVDVDIAACVAVKGDRAPIRRPNRIAIKNIIIRDLFQPASICIHHIDFHIPVPVGGEHDLAAAPANLGGFRRRV